MRKWLGLIMIVALVVLSACAAPAAPAEQGAAAPAADGAATEAAAAPASDTTGEQVTITYAIWDNNQLPAHEKIIEAFEAQHPNIKVEPQVVPGGDYWTKLQTAVAGAALLVLPKFTGAGQVTGNLFGDGLAVGAALSYAAYILAVRRARDGAAAGYVSLVSSAICAVFCLVAALALGEQIIPMSLQGWLAVAALGLVSHALGQGLITLSLGSYGAGAASLVMVWPALVSVLAAWALFGEQPAPVQAFGGVAILAAVLLVRRG